MFARSIPVPGSHCPRFFPAVAPVSPLRSHCARLPLLCLFLCILFALPAFPDSRGKWKVYVNANGINDVAVRGDTVWCATSGGVVRWDMKTGTYRQYTTLDGLFSNYVLCIAIGPDGTVWTGSPNGVCRFDGVSWRRISHLYGTSERESYCMAVAPDGSVWSSSSSMMSRYDGVSWTEYTTADGLPNGIAYDIVFDPDGTLWCSTSGGISRFGDGKWSTIPIPGSFAGLVADDRGVLLGTSEGIIYRRVNNAWVKVADAPKNGFLLSVSDETLWGGVAAEGGVASDSLYCIRDSVCVVVSPPDSVQSGSFHQMAAKDGGTVYVGTQHGLLRYDGVSWKFFLTDDTLPALPVRAVKVAPDGSVWFGGVGVVRFDGENWLKIPNARGVSRLIFAQNGVMWGAGNGLTMYDGSIWKDYKAEIGYPQMTQAGFTPWFAVSPNGVLWSEHYRGGLSRFDGVTWTTLTEQDGLPATNVYPLTVGLDGTLWCFATDRIYSFDGATWKSWGGSDGPDVRDMYTRMMARPDGTVCCTTKTGVSLFNGVRWETWASNAELGGTRIIDFTIGSNGSIWLGTGYGLYQYDESVWTHFTRYDGLASNSVNGVDVDKNGVVWLATQEGVSCFIPGTSVAGEEDRPSVVVMANYPNPFNSSTVIEFTFPVSSRAELAVYNAGGQKVRTIVAGAMSAGRHSVVWDGRDERGRPVASGLYFARLVYGKNISVKRMVVMK
jgi:ligand-binding sensor domain-containing protein